MSVEDNSQDTVVSLHREWVTLKKDAKVDVRLMGIGGEEDGMCFS